VVPQSEANSGTVHVVLRFNGTKEGSKYTKWPKEKSNCNIVTEETKNKDENNIWINFVQTRAW
jgi:hypothetical protein